MEDTETLVDAGADGVFDVDLRGGEGFELNVPLLLGETVPPAGELVPETEWRTDDPAEAEDGREIHKGGRALKDCPFTCGEVMTLFCRLFVEFLLVSKVAALSVVSHSSVDIFRLPFLLRPVPNCLK